MEKVFVAQRVVKKLVETEEAVDAAFAEAAELMSVMLKARKDVNADIKFADDAQAKLMEAMAALSEARTAMVGVHNQLGEAKLRLGIRTKLMYETTQNSSMLVQDEPQVEVRQVG
jgi:hypothetical protein